MAPPVGGVLGPIMDELDQIKELLPHMSHIEDEKETVLDSDITVEKTPMVDENIEINSSVSWEKAFQELFLEVLDFELGYHKSKINFTNSLLNAGVQYNPQTVYQLVDLMTTRMERIHIAKRLCNFLGLHNEMDKIVDAEMELIYGTPKYNVSKTTDITNPIAGEMRNG